MNVKHFHRKSPLKSEAEDAFTINADAGIYAVMDGVTPLHTYRDENGHNGAYLAANEFKANFEHSGPYSHLIDIFTYSNRCIREKMIEAGADLSIMHELWSTCVAAVQIQGNSVNFAHLGDSMIVAVYQDGRVATITENRVKGLSARAKQAREQARSEGAILPDESYYDVPLHRNQGNRWMANHPNGYGVANGMEEITIHLQSGQLQVAQLKHLLLLTDGLFHPALELEDTCRRIIEQGFEQYADEVVVAEQQIQALPDDRTGILISF